MKSRPKKLVNDRDKPLGGKIRIPAPAAYLYLIISGADVH